NFLLCLFEGEIASSTAFRFSKVAIPYPHGLIEQCILYGILEELPDLVFHPSQYRGLDGDFTYLCCWLCHERHNCSPLWLSFERLCCLFVSVSSCVSIGLSHLP